VPFRGKYVSKAWAEKFGKYHVPHFSRDPYIRRALDDPPSTEAGQLLWIEAQDFINQARDELGIRHVDLPYGHPRPEAPELWQRERKRAIDMTASYCRRLGKVLDYEQRGVA
jgi:hypothetical protein